MKCVFYTCLKAFNLICFFGAVPLFNYSSLVVEDLDMCTFKFFTVCYVYLGDFYLRTLNSCICKFSNGCSIRNSTGFSCLRYCEITIRRFCNCIGDAYRKPRNIHSLVFLQFEAGNTIGKANASKSTTDRVITHGNSELELFGRVLCLIRDYRLLYSKAACLTAIRKYYWYGSIRNRSRVPGLGYSILISICNFCNSIGYSFGKIRDLRNLIMFQFKCTNTIHK